MFMAVQDVVLLSAVFLQAVARNRTKVAQFQFRVEGLKRYRFKGFPPIQAGLPVQGYRSIPSIDVFGNIKFQAPNSK